MAFRDTSRWGWTVAVDGVLNSEIIKPNFKHVVFWHREINVQNQTCD